MIEICRESYNQELGLLTTIPGIKSAGAMTIPAGLGIRPQNDESAGKIIRLDIFHSALKKN
jgi:hypothetical protein